MLIKWCNRNHGLCRITSQYWETIVTDKIKFVRANNYLCVQLPTDLGVDG